MLVPRTTVLNLFLPAFLSVNAQCLDRNFAFTTGEDVEYEVYYNLGFIWLNAGYVEFRVKDAMFAGRPVYHFDAYGSSYPNYDWIFKVRDHYQTYLDKETLLPLWFHRLNYEGGYEVDNKYYFDHKRNRAISYTSNSDKPFSKDTVAIPDCTYDLLSLLYYCRNLDFTGLKIGDTIPIRSIIDNEIFELYIRYLGRETIKNRDGTEYRCIKFSALLIEGTIFKGGEDMYAWITDDKNRIPVLVEAKILIGSVKAYLRSTEGLKNPVRARVDD